MISSFLLASFITLVQLNCENLFDCHHDSLKQDTEFLPEAPRHWSPYRYWRKLDGIGRAILSCGETNNDYNIPDLVALCEVENDSVMRDLTKRSLLRNARYEYIMTDSPDERGIDVALLYHEFSFAPISHSSIRVKPIEGMAPTRDILYVCGRIITDDTLHIFVLHAPSRRNGERASRRHRLAVASHLCMAIDSIKSANNSANIIVAGDFNAYANDTSIALICKRGLCNVTANARGRNGAKATYRYKGKWGSLDHILLSPNLCKLHYMSNINDAKFLIENDETYGGIKPKRTYNGYRYCKGGISDHLPLVTRLKLPL